jgi:DNA-binding NarL/FixJ family response regulator
VIEGNDVTMVKKVLLVDDHALYRGAVRRLIQLLYPDSIFCEAGDLAESLQQADQNPDCDLVLFDLGLPDTTGLEGLRTFRATFPKLSVVVLSGEDSPEMIQQALAAGAAGFVPKSLGNEQLAKALEYVLTGGAYMAEKLLNPDGVASVDPGDLLSARQLQLLNLMAEDCSDEEIADKLGEKIETVRSGIEDVFGVLGVNSRIKAAVKAEKLGLLKPDIQD